ncbi:hypothetical protein M5X11_28105 [Paenibacillus alginolyticus]|uniref:hypothetical protein n=1 Tax=Paenibacillus alginolyticus TaxID=59839 RepID=UPI000421199A|nr:hypothetical protein [Paenibacillus alginolyticus]MCY9668742.1 hypothetical protein [Paenibacillus alginolyticus]
MNKPLKTKRVWIVTLVFLLFAAGLAYADYTLDDGSVVQWSGGDTLNVINPDGSSYATTGVDNGSGRLVPVDNSFSDSLAWRLPSFNSDVRDGMNNANMTVPIMNNGQFAGWADVYGSGVAYQGDTAVRSSNEATGNTVDWNGIHNGYGGGIINISSPGQTYPPEYTTPNYNPGTLLPNGSSSGDGNSYSGGGSSYTPYVPYIPPAPYVTSITVSGPDSATAAQTYSYTATAYYNNGNHVDVTSSASWSNGPNFTPQNEGSFTVSATYTGITGSRQVQVVLPPAATPPGNPPVRLY